MSTDSSPLSSAARDNQANAAGGLWLVQAFTGLLLVSLLFLHMIAHHFVVEGGLRTFEDVVAYISNPFIFVIELVFLVVVTLHALLGVRAIVLDVAPRPMVLRVVNVVLVIIGVACITYGAWLALVLQRL